MADPRFLHGNIQCRLKLDIGAPDHFALFIEDNGAVHFRQFVKAGGGDLFINAETAVGDVPDFRSVA